MRERGKGEKGREAERQGGGGTGPGKGWRVWSCRVFSLLLPKLLKPAPQSFYYFKNKRFSSQQNKANKPTRANIPEEKLLLFSLKPLLRKERGCCCRP